MDRFADRPERKGPLSFWAGYGLAAGSTALAALARWLVPWALTPAPYLGFYPAVVVSAALGGVGPGLVATFASLFLVNFVFGHFNVYDHGAMARQVIWVAASIGVSLLAGMQRSARVHERLQAEELRRWNDELENRVAAQTVEIRKTNEKLEQQVADRTSALRASDARLRRFYESNLIGIIYWNMNGEITDANDKFLTLVGYSREELKTGQIDWVNLTPAEYRHLDEAAVIELKATGVNKEPFEKVYIRKDGTHIPIIIAGSMIDEERFNGVAFVIDISERKRAEEQIKASLAEKEVMLKEIHHRVKNNLQVISSLVNLQADGTRDETVREVLRDVTYRVRSMALVHEKLYQSADLAHIDFAEYARSLLGYLWRAHGAKASVIRLTFDLEPLLLPVDTAVPCGLILNELAGNALKHAFPDQRTGEVNISLHVDAERLVSMSVRDDGVGIPEGLDWRKARSLGLRLMQMLAGQLNATTQLNRIDGTEFLITFKLPETALDGETSHG
jgi:PAS domain S-box-containing protein